MAGWTRKKAEEKKIVFYLSRMKKRWETRVKSQATDGYGTAQKTARAGKAMSLQMSRCIIRIAEIDGSWNHVGADLIQLTFPSFSHSVQLPTLTKK